VSFSTGAKSVDSTPIQSKGLDFDWNGQEIRATWPTSAPSFAVPPTCLYRIQARCGFRSLWGARACVHAEIKSQQNEL